MGPDFQQICLLSGFANGEPSSLDFGPLTTVVVLRAFTFRNQESLAGHSEGANWWVNAMYSV